MYDLQNFDFGSCVTHENTVSTNPKSQVIHMDKV
jgi:hypothetical protein